MELEDELKKLYDMTRFVIGNSPQQHEYFLAFMDDTTLRLQPGDSKEGLFAQFKEEVSGLPYVLMDRDGTVYAKGLPTPQRQAH